MTDMSATSVLPGPQVDFAIWQQTHPTFMFGFITVEKSFPCEHRAECKF